MTGRCYYCTADVHEECYNERCTCCGERNRKHNEEVAKLVGIMQVYLEETGFYASHNRQR